MFYLLQGFSAGLYAFFRDKDGVPLTPRARATNKPPFNDRSLQVYITKKSGKTEKKMSNSFVHGSVLCFS